MRYSTFLAVIALPLLLVASHAWAGPITYDLVDYPTSQGGYHISGTMMTDGTLGIINTSNVLSWSFTISNPQSVSLVTVNSVDVGAGAFVNGLIATETALLAPRSSDVALTNNVQVTGYEIISGGVDFGRFKTTKLWEQGVPGPNFTYAQAVPEPATLSLLGIGIAGMAGYAWRRRRTLNANRHESALMAKGKDVESSLRA